jgi:hypothetical protein
MRKVICLLFVVITSTICFGQTKKVKENKPTDIDKGINFKLDSLTKVYKMKIYSYGTITDNGITRHFVGYIEGDELKKKYIPMPVK